MSTLFSTLTEADKKSAVERLIADSTPRDEYFLMIVLATLMATLGLLMNNAVVIIGSMLIAPLLSPILGVAMGVVMADAPLIQRSALTVVRSIIFSVLASAVVALLMSTAAGLGDGLNSEISLRLRPDLLPVFVAIVAGTAASYAIVKPQLSVTLPGVAVSVSLIPPLAVVGMGIARFDGAMIANAMLLFLVNAGFIILSAVVVFSLMRIATKQHVAVQAMKKEDAQLVKEKEEAAKIAAAEKAKLAPEASAEHEEETN